VAANITPELLAMFSEPGFDPVAVTIGGLATVRMDARYQVVEVLLHRPNAGEDQAEAGQLELALKEAFNEASRRVMELNAARLSALMAQSSSEKPPASAS
jgi:hypothetical protein